LNDGFPKFNSNVHLTTSSQHHFLKPFDHPSK